MRIPERQIADTRCFCLYLFGEDEEALRDSAERWLNAGGPQTLRMRLELAEQDRFERHLRAPSLFGRQPCRALIRNAHAATAKDAERWRRWAGEMSADGDCRLLLCAVGAMHKKSWHKSLLQHADIAYCEFRRQDGDAFLSWLRQALADADIELAPEDVQWAAERLRGLRGEARQWIERLRCWQGGQAQPIPREAAFALCGEHAPTPLDAWCDAVVMRKSQSLALAHRLICQQHVSALQMLAWLERRFSMLLMYAWHRAQGHADPVRAAGLFGAARVCAPQAVRHWSGRELMRAMHAIGEAERRLKGASRRPEHEIVEDLLMRILRHASDA